MPFSTKVVLLLVCSPCFFFGKSANSQTPATILALEAGARVRVTSSEPGFLGSPTVANVLAQRGDTLFLRREGTRDTLPISLRSITQLDVSTGRSSHIGKGMGLGFLGGAVIGAILGAATHKSCSSGGLGPPCFSQGGDALAAGLVVGVLGTLAGGAIGAVWQTENWERLAVMSVKLGFRVAPSGTGGLMVSATF